MDVGETALGSRPALARGHPWPSPWQLPRYWGYLRRPLMEAVTFRSQVIIWWVVLALYLYILVVFWRAVYGATSSAAGYTLPQMVAYVVGGQVLGFAMSASAQWRLDRMVRDGTIVLDLLRPTSLPGALLAESVGEVLGESVMFGLPLLVLGVVLFHARFAGRPTAYPLLAVLIAFATVLRFLIAALLGYTAFWTVRTRGIGEVFYNVFLRFLGGAWVPYAFFPRLLRNVLPWTPMAGLFNAPLNFLVGRATASATVSYVAADALWVVLLSVLLWWTHLRAMRRVLSHGG